MRLQLNLELNTDWLIKDYRRMFMALIKNIISDQDQTLYTLLYGTNESKRKVNKPFTFSVHFPLFKGVEKDRFQCGNKAHLIFSTNDETIITTLYNGLQRKKEIVIGESFPIIFKIENSFLLPEKKIRSNKVEFKTIAPVLVNLKGDNLTYIPPTHSKFGEAFIQIICNQAMELNIQFESEAVHFDIQTMKKLPLSHYNQTMTSWLGEFSLEAPKEVLQLVYDTGIGVRRSQGFGMLEIKKQF